MDKAGLLFDSVTEPVPPLRRELTLIPVAQNGDRYLYVEDAMGYAPADLALKAEVQSLLILFDGVKSISELMPMMGEGVTERHLLDFVQFLDRHRLLHSRYLKRYRREVEETYEASPVHSAVTAGSSYPSDPEELKQQMNEALKAVPARNGDSGGTIRALFAPHIDPRVSMQTYAGAFSSIARLRPKRVVILGTSHYSGLFPDQYEDRPFILVDKEFRLPNGTVPVDRKMVDKLKKQADETGISTRDRAHRMEHSLELHMVWLRHLWNHDFRVIPILVGSLEELYFMRDGHRGKQLDAFAICLRELFGEADDTLFLVSGDFSHFGRKFGDSRPAREMFDEVGEFDREFIDRAAANRSAALLSLVAEEEDPYRICGFPPLFTLLETFPDLRGESLNYDLWDERERESAVTFGSILYR